MSGASTTSVSPTSSRAPSGSSHRPQTASVTAERPVVLAEQREQPGPQVRFGDAIRATFFAGQPLADRSPIGNIKTLEAATGVTGLSERSPVREHVWFDPADPKGKGNGARPRRDRTAADSPAPTVPVDSEHADEVAQGSIHEEPVTPPRSTRKGAGPSRSARPARRGS